MDKIPRTLIGVAYKSPIGETVSFTTKGYPVVYWSDSPTISGERIVKKITFKYLEEGRFIIITGNDDNRIFLRFDDCFDFKANAV